MFRFMLALQGRELFSVEFGTPEPEPVSNDGGDFAFGFGPPADVESGVRSRPIEDTARSCGRHTEE